MKKVSAVTHQTLKWRQVQLSFIDSQRGSFHSTSTGHVLMFYYLRKTIHFENIKFPIWIYLKPFSFNCLQNPRTELTFLSCTYKITIWLCFTLTFPLLSLIFSPSFFSIFLSSHLLLKTHNNIISHRIYFPLNKK